MGFNKLNLPEVKQLKEQLAQWGEADFTNYWKNLFEKRDAICGPTESHDFIKLFLNREYNYRTTGQLELDFDWTDI